MENKDQNQQDQQNQVEQKNQSNMTDAEQNQNEAQMNENNDNFDANAAQKKEDANQDKNLTIEEELKKAQIMPGHEVQDGIHNRDNREEMKKDNENNFNALHVKNIENAMTNDKDMKKDEENK